MYGDPQEGDPAKCTESGTPLACSVQVGGILDKEISSSWRQSFSSNSLQNAYEFLPDHDNDLPGTETIRINSSLALSDFPVGIMKIPYRDVIRTPSNFFGLARNSTLLNRLSSAGLIASRTWGYYQGWTGAETQHQLDGSLVLGGYDEAKTTGKNTTLSFSDNKDCVSGLLVTVSDIKMNLQNVTDLSIFGSSAASAMSACLNPTYRLISLPLDIWNSFVQFSGVEVLYRSRGINSWAMLISGNGSLVSFSRCMM